MLKTLLRDYLFRRLEQLEVGTLKLTTPDGKTHEFVGKQTGINANITLRDWRVIKNMVLKGDIGLVEDYCNQVWETDDLEALIRFGIINYRVLNRYIVGSKLSNLLSMLNYLLKLNSVKGSKKNILAHYDLGNDFYQLWLDPSMTYSAAIFAKESDNLETAQFNKYDRLLNRLTHSSGSLLEIGCGWGGFAERAQSQGDFNIKGITLSKAQHDYAQERLDKTANIVMEDYRHQNGRFDHIVSIEMFEAVGERYWKTYFDKIKQLLNQNGKALIQTITMNEADYPTYRRSGDFIRSYIFPGGMLPSLSSFKASVHQAGLKTEDIFCFGQDYAKTLKLWLDQFEHVQAEVKQLGFDDQFIRLWRFYLAACIAAFKTEHTNVMQIELSHA